MKGIFLRKKFNLGLFLLFACGVFFIALYIFLNIVDTQAPGTLLSFLIPGILICVAVIPSWLLNRGAFLHIDEESIHAKYHWFGKIHSKLSDVEFVSAQVNTLNIQLKSGKSHTIMGLANPGALCAFLRRRIPFAVTEQPQALIQRRNALKAEKKRGMIWCYSGVALMFIILFATVFLTGEKDLHEFGTSDWIIMAVMGTLELITVVGTFYFAQQTGKKNIPLQKLHYEICRTNIETCPLLSGNVKQVYTDEHYMGRITVFRYPGKEAVYYAVEQLRPDYTLVKTYDSEIFDNMEALPEGLGELIDITEKFFITKTAE